MTRFNRDLAGRVERDLNQISDQATPSSTAWEAIRHRIDEQDSTQPTMEVIMLDPDTNKLQKRPRTGMLVAASVAAIAVVGGLFVVANRDDGAPPADRPDPVPTVAVTDPAIAGDPAPVVVDPEDPIDPETAPEGQALPPVEPLSQGAFIPTCASGDGVPDPENGRLVVEQDCTIVGVDAQPFNADQVLELSLLETVGTAETPAEAFVALGDNGFMNAGLLWDDGTESRWVGIAEGVDAYEGEPVFLSATSSQNADGSLDELDGWWWTTDGPQPSATSTTGGADASEIVAEIGFRCEVVAPATNASLPVYECTYDDDAARFMPESERWSVSIIPADFGPTTIGPNSVMGSDFVVMLSEDGTSIRSGLATSATNIRISGVRTGTGEFEGSLLHESVWGYFTDPVSAGVTSPVEGVIQLTVLPPGS